MLKYKAFILSFLVISFCSLADTLVKERPADFVDAKQVIPQLQTDIRYDSDHNFRDNGQKRHDGNGDKILIFKYKTRKFNQCQLKIMS